MHIDRNETKRNRTERNGTKNEHFTAALTMIVLSEQLHSHHRKDEDDNAKYKCQITQSAHGAAHNRNE